MRTNLIFLTFTFTLFLYFIFKISHLNLYLFKNFVCLIMFYDNKSENAPISDYITLLP